MDAKSVNREDYAHTHGERFEARRPKDSDVLKGEGPFDATTQARHEYQVKKGERYDVKRPTTSDIWKVASKL